MQDTSHTWTCPFCRGVVDLQAGSKGLPAQCLIPESAIGSECLAFRDTQAAERKIEEVGTPE